MTDLLINLDLSSDPSKGQAKKESRKHQKFLQRRKYLERRGFLKQKQLPNKLPNRKPGQPGNSWDHNNGQEDSRKGGHDRTGRPNNNAFHKQGAPDTSSRTVTLGAPCQPRNCAPNQPRPASPFEGHNSANPFIQRCNLLSEYESGLPPVVSAASHKMVAIDCEMVGTGPKGQNSALARCSIVNYQGDVMYDKYVKPICLVTDYRTRWSGIRREHLVNAIPFSVAKKEVVKLLHGKIVVGHAIQNDFKALGYFHPPEMTRDTSKIPLLNQKAGIPENETASLKRLTKQVLHKDIQMGKSGHSSVEDAKATMELYRAVEAEYEMSLKNGAPDASSRTVTVGAQCQPQNCAPNPPRPASPFKGHNSSATDGAKQSAKPSMQQPNQLSQYKSGLPSAVSVPSYKVVAIDCEMVGTGPKGQNSALARCSIVNYQGDVMYDKYVKPICLVTDYRTRWSGIRREHLVNAIPFSVAKKEVLKLLHGKIVVGHAIENDYKALGYFHPKEMTRDTSKIPLLNQKAGIPEKEMASLKRLTKLVLNKDIQVGKSGHSSVEDAKATMELYRAVEAEYERQLAAGTVQK